MAINQLVFETIESLIRLLIFAALSKIILIKIWFEANMIHFVYKNAKLNRMLL